MRTGYNGPIAICWTQTELDGLLSAPVSDLNVGAVWSWCGAKAGLTIMDMSDDPDKGLSGSFLLGRGAGCLVRVQARLELSNGAQRFIAELVSSDEDDFLGLVFKDACPTRDQDFWVSSITDVTEPARAAPAASNVVAFQSSQPVELSPPEQVAVVAAE